MKKIIVMVVLCLCLVGMIGTVAYASDLEWKTTHVRNNSEHVLEISGYFTNNRADRVITNINWFQPNVTLTYDNGCSVLLDEKASEQECYIQPGTTYNMTFYISNEYAPSWIRRSVAAKYNYKFSKIEG